MNRLSKPPTKSIARILRSFVASTEIKLFLSLFQGSRRTRTIKGYLGTRVKLNLFKGMSAEQSQDAKSSNLNVLVPELVDEDGDGVERVVGGGFLARHRSG